VSSTSRIDTSSRWVKLTRESAEAIKKHGLVETKTPGVSHAMTGKPGAIKSWLHISKGPGSLRPDSRRQRRRGAKRRQRDGSWWFDSRTAPARKQLAVKQQDASATRRSIPAADLV
jgi:hypothetical protein